MHVRRFFLPLLSVAVMAAVAATAGAAATPARPLSFGTLSPTRAAEVSSNWSGYAAVAADGASVSFGDVTGTWVQPRVRCSDGRQDAVAFWVGLGGYSSASAALEQLGTAAECSGSSSTPVYYAWWEIVPAPSVPIPMTIKPGDRVNAAVLVNGQKVTMSLKNLTRHTRFSKTITATQPLDVSSAEWIAEAPSSCSSASRCRPIPLTNFGTVAFTNAALIGNGHPGTINDALATTGTAAWSVLPIELVADGSGGRFFGSGDPLGTGVGAVPGALSTDGRSFSVSWQQKAG